ncbi:MAG: type IV pilus twitching motility protein PilT [Planctomycetota bacterium]
MHFDDILKSLIEKKGSDLHLKADRPPLMRILGDLLPSEFPALSDDDIQAIFKKIMPEKTYQKYLDDFEADVSYQIPGVARFRVNTFFQQGRPGAAIRLIPVTIPTIDQMRLPPVLKDIVAKNQGLILVTGPTGSGKSTSLAAMIDHINATSHCHIITIEDPIEFVYTDKLSTINQRQLGADTKSLTEALRRALRQDPDVILMGEIRDRDTMSIAMEAAQTGHLVLATLHTNDAKQTVDRVLDTFPPDEQNQVRGMLAMTLLGVVCQRLVRKADGTGRVAAVEILINSPKVADLIREGKTRDIDKAMVTAGAYYRMQTFNQALAELVKTNVITQEMALETSATPDDLKLMLRGVMASGDTGARQAVKTPEPPPPPAAPAAKPDAAATPAEGKIKISKGY